MMNIADSRSIPPMSDVTLVCMVEKSLLENTTWFASDPYQGGKATHNDNIQVMKGRNITIYMNTIRGAQNFAVLGSASIGDTPNLVIRGNWLDGGHCTVKLQSLKTYRLKVQLAHNRFGPHRKVSYCPANEAPSRSSAVPEERTANCSAPSAAEASNIFADASRWCLSAVVVTAKPGGTGKPTEARRARLAAFAPSSVWSRVAASAKVTTSGVR